MCPFFLHIIIFMRNLKKSLPYLLVALVLTMTSCEEKKNGGMSGETYLEEYEQTPTWEELLADSIVEKEHVGKECAVICNNLDIATDRLTHVLSPEGLISAKKQYILATTNLSNDMQGLSGQEKSLVQTYKATADKAYRQACQEYEVPADGVIANLKDLIRDIDKVNTKQEMSRYEECRLGVLRNLDNVYLCVEQNSKSIPEVKRLAQTLKSKYESKQHELGIK